VVIASPFFFRPMLACGALSRPAVPSSFSEFLILGDAFPQWIRLHLSTFADSIPLEGWSVSGDSRR
jgi:hypothetical protein